ncbi:hypothetical protein ACOTZF_24730 [Enterobacter cloacae complex sp. SHL021]|uniref:hypothetical protein n=1 Tax=Enterobacter cloacae complex TaxID=354276 RepID=UPI001F505060|nr:hypothetical protein [Enterobacter cloacae]
MKLFEMEGFLRGKCLPGDMKVNETNAEYLVRKFTELEQKLAESQREFRAADATIENLQMKLNAEREAKLALAAENAGLKKFCKDAAFDADYEAELGMDRGGFTDALNDIKTPATDAFLAEVRAQGVEMFARETEKLEWHESTVRFVLKFADQLRKGVQS